MHEGPRLEVMKHAAPMRKEIIGDRAIPSRDIPKLFTSDFWQAAGIWNSFKMYGLPFAGGWAEQPVHIIKVITIGEQEYNKWQREQTDASLRRTKDSNKGRGRSRR